jgi:hypothetical protein
MHGVYRVLWHQEWLKQLQLAQLSPFLVSKAPGELK